MTYARRAGLCRYPMPEGIAVANEMQIDRERDTLIFTSAQQRLEFEKRLREMKGGN